MKKETFNAPEADIIRYDETTSIVTTSQDPSLSEPD
jgi:hypothetical protein